MMAAQTAVTIAELDYRILKAGPRAEELAAAEAQVSQARAAVDAAKTQERTALQQVAMSRVKLRQTQAQLDLVRAGPREEDLNVARAQVRQAEAALHAAQVAANNAQLRAPFAGTVAQINVRAGEYVMMGAPAFALGDISAFRVGIIDLDEIDVARIVEGRRALITFDALPEVQLTGTVQRIALKSSAGAGGTAYKTIIAFDAHEPRLRWGMTAFADIGAK